MADPATDPEGTLAVAIRYAECGLRVLPIKPGTKRPPMQQWVEAATTDVDIIRNWFTGPLYADHGVGLAMGRQPDGRMVFALDVDEHDVAHSGSESLAELEGTQGSLPETVRSITGSAGLHLLFTTPVEVRNGIIGDGLDIRGEGGQIVVYPSVHPTTNRTYQWEDSFAPWEHVIAEAPGWLVARASHPTPSDGPGVVSSPVAAPGPLIFHEPDSPAEWLRSQWDWSLQLRDAGWTEHSVQRNGDVHWTRPGKERRDGESAVLHMPDGPFVVFSTDASVTGLHAIGRVNRDGSVSVSPFEFYAWHRHGGDLSVAARAIHKLMDPAASRLSGVVTPSALDGYTAQALDWPSFWTGDMGEDWLAEPIIANGRLTVLYAPAKMGKSEVTFAVVAAMATGRPILGQINPHGSRHVVYLDYEMTRADLHERLEQLGYTDADDLSCLHYYLLPSLPPLDTAEGATVMRQIAAFHAAEAVVIDTMGRAVEGDENLNDTYRAFARHTGLGLKADGIAVVRTDHAGKDKDKGQRGASAKNDDADVVFRVERTDAGWRLVRTHTRVGWVPESIVIDRTELADGTLRIALSPTSISYVPGTNTFVADLRAAGIIVAVSTTVRELTAAAKAAGMSKNAKAMSSALKWMKAELAPLDGPSPVARRLSPDEEPDLGDIR